MSYQSPTPACTAAVAAAEQMGWLQSSWAGATQHHSSWGSAVHAILCAMHGLHTHLGLAARAAPSCRHCPEVLSLQGTPGSAVEHAAVPPLMLCAAAGVSAAAVVTIYSQIETSMRSAGLAKRCNLQAMVLDDDPPFLAVERFAAPRSAAVVPKLLLIRTFYCEYLGLKHIVPYQLLIPFSSRSKAAAGQIWWQQQSPCSWQHPTSMMMVRCWLDVHADMPATHRPRQTSSPCCLPCTLLQTRPHP